jgi:hypothetical protein
MKEFLLVDWMFFRRYVTILTAILEMLSVLRKNVIRKLIINDRAYLPKCNVIMNSERCINPKCGHETKMSSTIYWCDEIS